ncbi:MAG: D-aminoacyl-tRNA deacylase [Planctomycetota bacterium]
MKAVIQRVREASVTVDGAVTGTIGPGMLILLGVAAADTDDDLALLVEKLPKFRIFPDADYKMNLSIRDTGGALLVVSQFTLFGSWRKGNRPGFTDAAPPEKGADFYHRFVAAMRAAGIRTETGVFGARMDVRLLNDGPVTFVLDTRAGDGAASPAAGDAPGGTGV